MIIKIIIIIINIILSHSPVVSNRTIMLYSFVHEVIIQCMLTNQHSSKKVSASGKKKYIKVSASCESSGNSVEILIWKFYIKSKNFANYTITTSPRGFLDMNFIYINFSQFSTFLGGQEMYVDHLFIFIPQNRSSREAEYIVFSLSAISFLFNNLRTC